MIFPAWQNTLLQRRGKVKVYQVTEPFSSTLNTALYHTIVRSKKEEEYNLIVKYIFWRLLLVIRYLQELIQLHANTSREKSDLNDDTAPRHSEALPVSIFMSFLACECSLDPHSIYKIVALYCSRSKRVLAQN